MPVTRFWLLHKNVDRLRAEAEHRQVQVILAAASGEGASKLMEHLQKQIGTVVEVDQAKKALTAERDRAGLMALKGMGKAA